MKKFKKTFAVILAALMLAASTPLTMLGAFAAEEELGYYEDGNGGLIIAGNSSFSGDVVIPETIDGKTVTAINAEAFWYSDITSITIPETVTYIGNSAFEGCESLESVVLPESLRIMGNQVFYNCDSLKSVIIPENVKEAGYGLFMNCDSLEHVEISTRLIVDREGMFSYCEKASSIETDADSTVIKWSKGSKTTSVSIGSKLDSSDVLVELVDILNPVNKITVEDGNASFKLMDGALYDADVSRLILYPAASTKTTFTFPSTVNSVEGVLWGYKISLDGADSLRTINIPAGAFEDSLSDMYENQDSVESRYCSEYFNILLAQEISMAFSQIFPSQLSSINVDDSNKYLSDKDGVFYNKTGNALYLYPANHSSKNFVFPEYVGTYALKMLTGMNYTITDAYAKNLYAAVASFYEGEEEIDAYCSVLAMMTLGFSTAKSFSVSETNKCFSVENGVLYNKNKTALVKYPIASDKAFTALPETVDMELVSEMAEMVFEDNYAGTAFVSLITGCNFNNSMSIYKAMEMPSNLTVHLSAKQAATLIESCDEMVIMGITNICVEELSAEMKQFNLMVDEHVLAYEKELLRYEIQYKNGQITQEEYNDYVKACNTVMSLFPEFVECDGTHAEFEIYEKGVTITSGNQSVNYKAEGKIEVDAPVGTKLTYTSSDENVVKVDENGNYTAVGEGTATITVTADGTDVSDSVEIKVTLVWWQWLIKILFFGFFWY